MDRMGGGSRNIQASRLLAVLWLFCASMAMQVISVGQSIPSRSSSGAQAGNVTDTGSSDRPVARQITRATPLSDLRFTAERKDAKSSTDDGLPALLPASVELQLPQSSDDRFLRRLAEHIGGAANHGPHIRAPPSA
ncbi:MULTISPECIES: hypothetical protein [unclassified Ensifer]|uniref:hypothetical protein n=1 Tax=unclassified Ensifer TaxID=2633371 RepID=UPI000813CB1C|nr:MULTISPECIES: hypothetical protein [unclassified Ensifer]OCP05052.1 hypothetical protein BC362_14965 [Ensifer sp. LC14]OCP11789.1 hypothetical protein BC374_16040 [Ensifer sp. LC13]OCP12346.1 hypothetical protein BBX50_16235 [Ensifer sp. LC11]OCP33687.1 hypothetical protein BC364_15605 [Ensifer sp. LC499]